MAKTGRFAPNQAFTLIEILVVVVLLAIIALVAIPYFVNLQDEAEKSRVQATAGALRSAVQSVQLAFTSKGYTTRIQNLPGFGSGNVDTNNIGYPIGIDKGNGNENIGRGNQGCAGVWNGVLSATDTVATNSSGSYQSYRHTGNRVCSYVYRLNGDTANRNGAQLVIQYDSRDGRVYVCGQQSGLSACPF